MILLTPPSATGGVRPCGLTRRELHRLRVLSNLNSPNGKGRVHKVRDWLLKETRLAAFGEPKTKLLAAVYDSAIQRCRARARRQHSRFQFSDGCPMSRLT